MISEAQYLHYLTALLDGDKKQCLQIVVSLLDNKVPLKEIYLNLFQRSMYRIGQMWENERCSVADEHIATKITESLIEIVAVHSEKRQSNGKLAVITCVDKEFHDLGARMVAGFMEASGWSIMFVGSNTPHSEVVNLIKDKRPDIVGLSNNFYINIARLSKLIASIKNEICFINTYQSILSILKS